MSSADKKLSQTMNKKKTQKPFGQFYVAFVI